MARPVVRPPQARRIHFAAPGPGRVARAAVGAPGPQGPPAARPVAAEARPLVPLGLRRDAGRLVAAALSAILPGLGQLANGRRRLGAAFMVPTLLVVAVALAVVLRTPRLRLVASIVAPSTLDALLALNVALLAWRLVAVGHAFVDRRPRGLPTRWGAAGLLVLGLLVAAPHAVANVYGSAARDAFGLFFEPTTRVGAVAGGGVAGGGVAGGAVAGGAPAASAIAAPGSNERLNVLIIGLDKTATRTATLTDTLMVASVDPVLGSTSLVSIPRDLIGVPLGDGRTYAPKLNSLYAYAARNAAEFPDGPSRALEGAVGALLGIRIHYYVTTDFYGFVKLIDAIGGIDVLVDHGFSDPKYDAWDGTAEHWGTGWSVKAGPNHFDGLDALAYARSRYAPGESDFKRAARQQQILVAIKQKLMSGGDLLFRLPALLRTLGDTVRTDLPPERLPDLAALAETFDGKAVVRTVIQAPFVRGTTRAPYGSVQVPDLTAIRELAAHLFPAAGTAPSLWTPGASPSAGRSPAPSAAASRAP